MSSARFITMVLLGLAFVGIGLSAFTVNERELAIKLRLGEVIEAGYTLHDRVLRPAKVIVAEG